MNERKMCDACNGSAHELRGADVGFCSVCEGNGSIEVKDKKGCGEILWCADLYGYVPKCGIDGHLCKECSQLPSEAKQ